MFKIDSQVDQYQLRMLSHEDQSLLETRDIYDKQGWNLAKEHKKRAHTANCMLAVKEWERLLQIAQNP